MATLNSLKFALRYRSPSFQQHQLSEAKYSDGFGILQSSEWTTYQDFIIPQLSQLLAPLTESRSHLSVLEVGPGPESILGSLPNHLKGKITRYAAFEPNNIFASKLEESCVPGRDTKSMLPGLQSSPQIYRTPFTPDVNLPIDDEPKFDVVLFCHSMYGMKPKDRFIQRALRMLDKQHEEAMVVVFHRESIDFANLVCHRTATFPAGVVHVPDNDSVLDSLTPFIAGFTTQASDLDQATKSKWRDVCREMSGSDPAHPHHLCFRSPNVMITFPRHATALSELLARVPSPEEKRRIKDPHARLCKPASIIRPTKIHHVQQVIQWALKYNLSLTVLGGSHSDHCLWPHTVAVDMSAFNHIHILESPERFDNFSSDACPHVVVEAGCTVGEIVQQTMAEGLTIPLGARPSVGAGSWLQGGIAHVSRLFGLACDSIVGAVLVSVKSGEVLYVGDVPSQFRPANAIRPEDEEDMLWAIRGAGTNFGVVISVTFNTRRASAYMTRNWIVPLRDQVEAQRILADVDGVAREAPADASVEVYLYWEKDRLHFGVSLFEVSMPQFAPGLLSLTAARLNAILGTGLEAKMVDAVGLFDTDMYMSTLHGGHGGGKTSSFKRCAFWKDVGSVHVAKILIAAIADRPSPLCYLHLLQGGGAIANLGPDFSAFGCRDWDFACVITGAWARGLDGTEAARAAEDWVYGVVTDLLVVGAGVYPADLGPDPRDIPLATKCFGSNQRRLIRLKQRCDPKNVLAYAFPLLRAPKMPELIILVAGESCAGKDYSAEIWATSFLDKHVAARVISISDMTKKKYAEATGADFDRILRDRRYKEQHRPQLMAFFQEQVKQRPRLLEEHFLEVVNSATDVDVLLITGMRDEAPVPTFSHLVPESRLIEVRVEASERTRKIRKGCLGSNLVAGAEPAAATIDENGAKDEKIPTQSPNLIFQNDLSGNQNIKEFAEIHLLPFLDDDLRKLQDMIPTIPRFPNPDVKFRHILNIAQQPGGLALCTSLLRSQFLGHWAEVDAVACCEAGGFLFASALAATLGVKLALIRKAGKLPPPVISVRKSSSHVSSLAVSSPGEERMEMDRKVISTGASVVVVDDVLASGETLCAMLRLMVQAGVHKKDVGVMIVAEFPLHRGRELLRVSGFGEVNVQSLLLFGGV